VSSTSRGRPRTGKDAFIEDFPFFGGPPGKAAMKFTAVWVTVLCVLAILIIYAIVTLHICLAAGLLVLTAIVGVLPRLFLEGSRI